MINRWLGWAERTLWKTAWMRFREFRRIKGERKVIMCWCNRTHQCQADQSRLQLPTQIDLSPFKKTMTSKNSVQKSKSTKPLSMVRIKIMKNKIKPSKSKKPHLKRVPRKKSPSLIFNNSRVQFKRKRLLPRRIWNPQSSAVSARWNVRRSWLPQIP